MKLRHYLILLLLVSSRYGSQATVATSLPNSDDRLQEIRLLSVNQPDSAYIQANDIFLEATQNGNVPIIADAAHIMGSISVIKGRFDLAIKNLLTALERYESLANEKMCAETSILLGDVYQTTYQFELADKYYEDAKRTFHKFNNTRGLALIYGKRGHIFEKKKQYDSALHFQNLALKSFKEVDDPTGLALIYDNIGSIYEDLENYDQAYAYFKNAYDINLKQGDKAALIINLNNLGDIHRKKGEFNLAIQYTTDALVTARSLSIDYQVNSAYRDLSKLYREQNNGKMALTYLDSAYEITREIYNRELAKEIAQTATFYELGRKEQQIGILKKDQQIERLIRYAVLGGVGFLIVISVIVTISLRHRVTKNKRLYEAEVELNEVTRLNHKLQEDRLEAEIANKKTQEEQLKRELELKSNTIAKSALHVIQKNEFLSDLKKKLKEIRKSDESDIPKLIKKLSNSIDFSFNLDDDWQEFETIFQQLHHEFFEQLKETYPDLTASEVRLCAMIRLNLNSKDMSTIMGISQDSLRIARYRLRKKLELDKGSNLYSHIINIG